MAILFRLHAGRGVIEAHKFDEDNIPTGQEWKHNLHEFGGGFPVEQMFDPDAKPIKAEPVEVEANEEAEPVKKKKGRPKKG
jgi:hypothetical protein